MYVRRPAVEGPIPALAQRDGLVGGPRDRRTGCRSRSGSRPARRRTRPRPGRGAGRPPAPNPSPGSGSARASGSPNRSGPNSPNGPSPAIERTLVAGSTSPGGTSATSSWSASDRCRDLVGGDARRGRGERRLAHRDTAGHHELAGAGERRQLVERDVRLEIGDAGDDGEREADRGNGRGRWRRLGRRGRAGGRDEAGARGHASDQQRHDDRHGGESSQLHGGLHGAIVAATGATHPQTQ